MPRKPKAQPRQRGSITPKGDGKYLVRVYVGTDSTGKREYASQLVTGTISQAQKARTALCSQVDQGTLARPTGETVGDFVTRFLTDVAKNNVEPGTLRGYEIQTRVHIVPDLGRIRLEDLTPFRVQQWISSMVEKELSYSSVRLAYVVLRMALSQAVAWNMIQRNPTDSVSLPAKLKAKKAEMKTFTADEMHRFLAGIDDCDARYQRYAAAFYTLLYMGLRPSEAAVVKWSDLDTDTRRLTIRRALAQVGSGTWVERPTTKTKAGMRTLAVPQALLTRLQAHRIRQTRERLAAGPEWQDNDYIFATKTGTFIAPNNMSRAWKKLCALTGVPAIRLYDARHTATTLELAAGVDIKTVSKRRGHSSAAFTLDTYAHVLDSMDDGAANAMDQLMIDTADKAATGVRQAL